ncbi:Glucokinase [Neochlamydia sp. AcF65]|uniref:ROK family protein n=1 Tax=Neochlamydia sp. AcF65 TaxID=2795735 RepID=UPI001BC91941|nr:ROK family protein [Neochlamydia sp. AcF65]MBS4165862.1 Glucokinase [Neochlamydia sp. AcF65]
MAKKYAIGMDIGGTKIEIGLVDRYGTIHQKKRISTHASRQQEVIEQEIIQTIQEFHNLGKSFICGIGIGVPGQVSAKDGSIVFAPNLNWHNISLKKKIEEVTSLPVTITNDGRAATWGEWLNGAGKGSNNIVCVFVGTGIGGGIVNEGKVMPGYTNCAGELGHMIIQMNGPPCTCGSHGCFEAMASGWAIAKKAKELVYKNPSQGKALLDLTAGDISTISAKLVIQAYKEGNILAGKILNEVMEALTIGCSNMINVFNPERLILGGGIIQGLPEAVDYIKKRVKNYSLKAATSTLEILPATFTEDAGTIGAGALAWHQHLNSSKNKETWI